MNKLPITKRTQVPGLLVEGTSINTTCRLTGVAKVTVLKLLADVGAACTEFQDKALNNLPCQRIQCDEIWSFVGAKQKNVNKGAQGYGDVWTWTALCADTKLIAAWMVGSRDSEAAQAFIADLASRLRNRVQLTTDGHKVYVEAVENAFAGDVDYAMLVKVYGEGAKSEQRRYSSSEFVCATKQKINGHPDMKHVSTSFVECQNLTMRRSCRRFTRLTNAFSKKIENHAHAVALHFMHYNFCRIHKTLHVTPAMEAGVSDHVWSLEEIAGLVPEPVAKKLGSYKKREI